MAREAQPPIEVSAGLFTLTQSHISSACSAASACRLAATRNAPSRRPRQVVAAPTWSGQLPSTLTNPIGVFLLVSGQQRQVPAPLVVVTELGQPLSGLGFDEAGTIHEGAAVGVEQVILGRARHGCDLELRSGAPRPVRPAGHDA